MAKKPKPFPDLPDPPYGPEVDLRDFPFMPLDVARLRDSMLTALATAEEFRAAVLLWCASWHQVPAGTLPDEDRALALLSQQRDGIVGWMKVRDMALRGYEKCSDGRLYHRLVSEKVEDAWERKEGAAAARAAERERKKEMRRAKREKNQSPRPAGRPEDVLGMSAGQPPDSDAFENSEQNQQPRPPDVLGTNPDTLNKSGAVDLRNRSVPGKSQQNQQPRPADVRSMTGTGTGTGTRLGQTNASRGGFEPTDNDPKPSGLIAGFSLQEVGDTCCDIAGIDARTNLQTYKLPATWLRAGDKAWPADGTAQTTRAQCLEEDVYATIEAQTKRYTESTGKTPYSLGLFDKDVLEAIARKKPQAQATAQPGPDGAAKPNPWACPEKFKHDDKSFEWWGDLLFFHQTGKWVPFKGDPPPPWDTPPGTPWPRGVDVPMEIFVAFRARVRAKEAAEKGGKVSKVTKTDANQPNG